MATHRYTWPRDTCASARASSESYPATCERPTDPLFVAFNETVQVQSLGSLTRSPGAEDPWNVEISHLGSQAVVYHGTSFPTSFVGTYSFHGRNVATLTFEWVPNGRSDVVPSYRFSEISRQGSAAQS